MKNCFNEFSQTIINVWLKRIEEQYSQSGTEFHVDFNKTYDEYANGELWDINLWSEGNFLGKYYWVAGEDGKIDSLALYGYYDLDQECQRLKSIGYFGSISQLKIHEIFIDREGKNPYIDIYFDKEYQVEYDDIAISPIAARMLINNDL